MRTSRLLAASSLLALSLGATVGTATAGAAAVSPTPTATSSATATPSGTPSATPSATGTASPSASASPTAKPTVKPTVPMPSPTPSGACRGYRTLQLKTTGSGLANTTIVKGGTPGELSVTFENTASVDLQKLDAHLFLTNVGEEEPVTNPVTWGKDAFNLQVKLPGGDWKSPAPDAVKAGGTYLMVDLGVHKLAKGAKLAFQVRVAPTDKAPTAQYYAQLDAGSEAFESKAVPGAPETDSCITFNGSFRVDDLFKVTDKNAATTPASGAPSSPSTKVSTSPAAGPHLAETGSSSNTLPIAVGGAAVLAAGAGTLFVLRRRKAGSHS
ncbi:LAETG motif-containing sortase-dependent surface protein [Kitasatospora hibisci]|uniref:LAETG motif-containing sortase-dependent surface protein n=1 Tax=Kitasatospora hibisci TaxID=3369522 RepID=UPI003754CC63